MLKLPNNKLTNYHNLINNGIISFNDSLEHKIKLEVSDIYGNISELNFRVKSMKKPLIKSCPINKDTSITFNFSKRNSFSNKDVNLNMEAYSLYEPINFNYNTTKSVKGVFGKVHHIHQNNTPVHKKYSLALKADIPEKIKSKVYIATTNLKGNFWYIGGILKNGFLTTKTKEFGNFCVIADTITPKITALNISPGKVLSKQKTIQLKIQDMQSGIASYRGEIDGKWVLMDYDYKKNLLKFDIEGLSKGDHSFTLEVIDKVGNATNYTASFTY